MKPKDRMAITKCLHVMAEMDRRKHDPLGKFKPNAREDGNPSGQEQFLTSTAKIRVFQAGNRSGKTVAGAVDCLMLALGRHPHRYIKPPVKIWAVARDNGTPKDVMFSTLMQWCPKYALKEYLKSEQKFIFWNGSTIQIKSSESGREKFQGESLDVAWLDEETHDDVVEEICFRLIDSDGVMMVTATPIIGRKWIRELINDPETHVIRGSMFENNHISLERAKKELAKLPEDVRRVRESGDFMRQEGKVFVEFQRGLHVIAPFQVNSNWPVWCGIDYGMAVTAAVFIAVSPESDFYVFRTYYGENRSIEPNAAAIKAIERSLCLVKPVRYVIDPNAVQRTIGSPRPIVSLYKDAGINARLGKNSWAPSIERIRSLMLPNQETKLPKIYFFSTCERLIKEIDIYHLDTKSRADGEKAKKEDDHGIDAMRYAIMDSPKFEHVKQKSAMQRLIDSIENEKRDEYLPSLGIGGY